MKKLLYIDACVNRDVSRTERLAQALLKEMNKNGEYEVETLCLEDEDLKLFTGKESAGRASGSGPRNRGLDGRILLSSPPDPGVSGDR